MWGHGAPPAPERAEVSRRTFTPNFLPLCVPTPTPAAVPSSFLSSPLLHAQWLTFLERSAWAGLCAKRFLALSPLVET